MSTPHSAHDESHEQRLHAHLAGDVEAADPGLQEQLRRCSSCRSRLAELQSVTELLEQVGSERRRSLRELPDPATAPGAERVASTLRALAAGQAPPRVAPAPRSTQLWRISLAAASVLAAGWLVKALLPDGEAPGGDVTLGESVLPTLTPGDGAIVEEYGSFSWRDEAARSRHFELRIWAVERSASDEPLITAHPTADHWEPTPQQRSDLPDAIFWEIVGYDDLGAVCFGGNAGVTRRRP